MTATTTTDTPPDEFCQCGYRASQHRPDGAAAGCGLGSFKRSMMFNDNALPPGWTMDVKKPGRRK